VDPQQFITVNRRQKREALPLFSFLCHFASIFIVVLAIVFLWLHGFAADGVMCRIDQKCISSPGYEYIFNKLWLHLWLAFDLFWFFFLMPATFWYVSYLR